MITEANSSPVKYRVNYILSFNDQTDVILDQMVLDESHLILLKSLDPRCNKFYMVFLSFQLHEQYSGIRQKPSQLLHFVMEMPANITCGCFFVDKLENPEDPQVELLLQMDHCVLKVPPFSHLLDSNQVNLNLPRSQNKIIDCSQMISGIYSDKYRLNVQECKIQRELGEDDQDDFC